MGGRKKRPDEIVNKLHKQWAQPENSSNALNDEKDFKTIQVHDAASIKEKDRKFSDQGNETDWCSTEPYCTI